MTQHRMFGIETVAPKIRKVTFSNPPVNVVGEDTVAQLLEVVDQLSRDEQVQVVIFDSSTPGYKRSSPATTTTPIPPSTTDGSPEPSPTPNSTTSSMAWQRASHPSTRRPSWAPRHRSTGQPCRR